MEPEEEYAFGKASVLAAIEAVREGKCVVVTDDEGRENEGDLIFAAEKVRAMDGLFMSPFSQGLDETKKSGFSASFRLFQLSKSQSMSMSHILALWNLDFRQDSEEKVSKLVKPDQPLV